MRDGQTLQALVADALNARYCDRSRHLESSGWPAALQRDEVDGRRAGLP